ncbi:NFACT family protein [Candidatus Bathyarchaeota archaeon]|nr:NFACT family protein [Candidatus Bathyarchaeota archaeon]
MNGIDIAVILSEIKSLVEKLYVDSIYLMDKILVLKLRGGGVSRELVVDIDRAIYLTAFEKVKPIKPHQFVMFLRKYLSGLKVSKVSQRGLEKIVEVSFEGGRGKYTLVIELFGNGNLVFLDENRVVKAILRRVSSKTRTIKPGSTYQYPPTLEDPREAGIEKLMNIKKTGSKNLQFALSKATGLPSPYSEEVITRAGFTPTLSVHELDAGSIEKIYDELRAFLNEIFERSIKPVVYMDEKGLLVDFSPIPLTIYRSLKAKFYGSFAEAVDAYFSELYEHEKNLEEERKLKAEAEKYRIALDQQMGALSRLLGEAKTYRSIGMLLMNKLHSLQAAFFTFKELAQSRGFEEAEDAFRRELAQEGLNVVNIEMDGRFVELDGFGVCFKLDTELSVAENASRFFTLAKEAEEKAKRIREAMDTVGRQVEAGKEECLRVKRSGAWYEYFRYTFTGDGFLIVGGKDASTNELLLNKYMEPEDVVFHADYIGSPFVLLKTNGREPTPEAIWEASVITACYSRAWSDGLANLDVFYVKPDQVSKSPPSGEYIKSGGFMIRGDRNYVRKIPLKLCIGVKMEEDGIIVLPCSEENAKKLFDVYVSIRPGNVDKRRLAEKIVEKLKRRLGKVLKRIELSIDCIYRLIPGSGGVLED